MPSFPTNKLLMGDTMRYPPAAYSSIRYHRLADLRGRTTEWLWPGWLPLGKLALIEGDPGLGKSLVTLDLCARLTAGREFPDGSPAVTPLQRDCAQCRGQHGGHGAAAFAGHEGKRGARL
jgi:hypothetical protein